MAQISRKSLSNCELCNTSLVNSICPKCKRIYFIPNDPPSEGCFIDYQGEKMMKIDGQLQNIAFGNLILPNLCPEEINTFTRAEILFGLLPYNGLLHIIYKVGNIFDGQMTFDPHLCPEFPTIEHAFILNFRLIEGTTFQIRAERHLLFPEAFTQQLRDLIAHAPKLTEKEKNIIIESYYNQYPHASIAFKDCLPTAICKIIMNTQGGIS